jgi:hypothetical protein
VDGSTTSQVILIDGSSVKGSSTAVAASGIRIMSDSLMPFQPATEDPSNIWPSVKVSSLRRLAGIETCCSLPLVSVNLKSTNLTPYSLMVFNTSAADMGIGSVTNK